MGNSCTVKPVLRGQLWGGGCSFKTGDLLKEVQCHMKFSMTGQEKGELLNTGDCLIEVTALAGLPVYM